MATTFNVVTFLWHDPKAKHTANFSYGPDHVNKLFRQLAKGFEANGIEDFKLTVVTDAKDITGFDTSIPGFQLIPLWDDFRDIGRCFTKLKVFSREHKHPVHGDDMPRNGFFDGDFIITIDIDVVITKPKEFVSALTSSRMEAFKGYRDTKNPRCYSGALWRIDTRSYNGFHHVYDTFRHIYDINKGTNNLGNFYSNWNVVSSFVGSDQCWITTAIGEFSYPNKWSDEDGIYDEWQITHLPSLPLNTCAVFMNGMNRDMTMPKFQEKYPWIIEHWVNV